MAGFAIAVRARVDSASPEASSRPGAGSYGGMSISRVMGTPRNRELIFND